MKEIQSDQLHPILLDEAKEFHNICVRNNIRYWMLGGTQLGSVRHNGFIPWDDDMDFGVMQEDWERLIVALEKELPSPYKCRTRFNCEVMYGNTLKIENTRTIINPNQNLPKESWNIGVNIDVFPLVYTNGHKHVFSRNWCAAKLLTLQYWRFGDYGKSTFVNILIWLTKVLGLWLKKGDITDFVNRFLLPNKGEYIVNFWGRWTLKEIVHRNIMGEPCLQTFENTKFYGVSHTHEYLTHLYGKYMEMPAKDKMNLHISKMYWK